MLIVLLLLAAAWVAGYGTRDQFIGRGDKAGGGASTMQAMAVNAAEPPSRPGKYGGTITDTTMGDPKTFNIWVATDSGSFGAGGPLFDSLVAQNPFSQKWEPRLCELPTVSADGRTWTFRLRAGLKWSDGVPLTADDLIFTLDLIFDTKTQGIMREGMLVSVPNPRTPGGFDQVPPAYRKVDDRTVEFKLPVPYAPAMSMLDISPAPRHVLYAAWKSGNINSTWNIATAPSQLVGSGAWVMSDFKAGQRITYKRNPYYWRKDQWGRQLPYFDSYVIRVVTDLNADALMFKSGQADFLSVQPDDYPDLKAGEATGGYKVYDLGPSFATNYIGFNLNPSSKIDPWKINLFRQIKFRQAVSYAINRDLICLNQFRGLASPLWNYVTPANKVFYNPQVPRYLYSPAKANQLLDQIGAKSNGSTYRQFEGHEIDFTVETNVENTVRKEEGIVISKDLKNVGLNVTFVPLAFNKVVTAIDAPPYKWDAIILGFTGGVEPNDSANIWYSSGPSHQWNPNQKTPATAWEAQIDTLFRQGAQELNLKKRVLIYDKWQMLASEQLPLIYTVVPDTIVAVQNKFGNLKPCPLGGASWNQDELYDLKATGTRPGAAP